MSASPKQINTPSPGSTSLPAKPPLKCRWFKGMPVNYAETAWLTLNSGILPATLTTTTQTSTSTNTTSTQSSQSAPQQASPQQDLNQVKLLPSVDKTFTLNSQIQWQSFDSSDCLALENAYIGAINQRSSPNGMVGTTGSIKVPVGDDQLYEVDINSRCLYPIYWQTRLGLTSQTLVCRATWFIELTSGRLSPVDELMAAQLEDGYAKFQPWRYFPDQDATSGGAAVSGNSQPGLASNDQLSVSSTTAFGSNKWNLFGPYHNYSVVYSGKIKTIVIMIIIVE